LASLNQCQMYIHAIHLSDICNGSSTAIDNRFWEGRSICASEYLWPTTAKPTTREWLAWKKMITLALLLGWNGQLMVPLGKWIGGCMKKDGFFLDNHEEHLYEQCQQRWYIYTRSPGHQGLCSIQEADVPKLLQCAKVIQSNKLIAVNGTVEIEEEEEENTMDYD